MTGVRAEVARLYEQHDKMRYPRGLTAGAEVAGVVMTLLDGGATSWIKAWLERDGEADEDLIVYLALFLDELHRVVPVFADPASHRYRPYAAHYFSRLREMVRLILLEVSASSVQGACHAGAPRSF
ncbi:hypothetical protein C8D87_106509 [Lentzea atacamensis]|uniref:Uncharacterized protein n=2 Tax=Lentzea atacamensis TaxID=531938 RepID=A0ABX9E7F5_9PSEU|nr:hypothetical protein C8D87_106509 [Lentzea atacamensis]